MRRRLRVTVISVVCGVCLLTVLAAGGLRAFDAYMRSCEPPEQRHADQLAPLLSPQAQTDDEGATGLTAEAVVAALEDAGFRCCAAGADGCSGAAALSTALKGALRHYWCYVDVEDSRRGLLVLSYRDSGEAQRVAEEANLANRSVDTKPCALSRGPIVLAVPSEDLEFVSRLRTMLDGVQ